MRVVPGDHRGGLRKGGEGTSPENSVIKAGSDCVEGPGMHRVTPTDCCRMAFSSTYLICNRNMYLSQFWRVHYEPLHLASRKFFCSFGELFLTIALYWFPFVPFECHYKSIQKEHCGPFENVNPKI